MSFEGRCLATFIGSFPGKDFTQTIELIIAHPSLIPCWPQLPAYEKEGMLIQFSRGIPGLDLQRLLIDPQASDFEHQLLTFYEEYMAVKEGAKGLSESLFRLMEDEVPGLFYLVKALSRAGIKPIAVKGQITGPFTLGTGLKTKDGKAVFYDPTLRDLITKLVGLRAAWQVEYLSRFGVPVIIFFDEPALAGFGSSAFVGVSREDIVQVLSEVTNEVRERGGIPGVHVCANTQWNVLVEAGLSIINFDAFGYLDRFLLFADDIKKFLEEQGLVAWGIVPTLKPDALKEATGKGLAGKLEGAFKELSSKTGLPMDEILSKSLVTPSCGMGTLTETLAEKAIRLVEDVSHILRKKYQL